MHPPDRKGRVFLIHNLGLLETRVLCLHPSYWKLSTIKRGSNSSRPEKTTSLITCAPLKNVCNSKSKVLSYQGYVQIYAHECLTEVVTTILLFRLCIPFSMYDTYSEQLLNHNLIEMETSTPCLVAAPKAHNTTNLLLILWTRFYILFQIYYVQLHTKSA